MNAQEVSEALVAWALDTCDELGDSGYAYPPMTKSKSLPDVVGGVEQESKLIRDPRFPISELQETGIRVWECSLSVMAEQGETDEESAAATLMLRTIVDKLFAAHEADSTLGGRVFDTGPELTADYEPGFVVYADGSRGREVRIALTAAEPLEASR